MKGSFVTVYNMNKVNIWYEHICQAWCYREITSSSQTIQTYVLVLGNMVWNPDKPEQCGKPPFRRAAVMSHIQPLDESLSYRFGVRTRDASSAVRMTTECKDMCSI